MFMLIVHHTAGSQKIIMEPYGLRKKIAQTYALEFIRGRALEIMP